VQSCSAAPEELSNPAGHLNRISGETEEFLEAPRETELEFYSRRAMEEARSAKFAATPQAAAAHRYLAAAYAALIARETQTASQLDELARRIP
jgi:hypothetical protein